MRFVVSSLTALSIFGLIWSAGGGQAHAAHGGPSALVRTALTSGLNLLEQFTGAPSAPTPWSPDGWDVTVHSRDDLGSMEPMHAEHGANCDAPPSTHLITQFEQTVFQCRDHVMTAINAEGYGVIYLTPDSIADFSNGESVIRFDMSTARTSIRDWVDVWVSPYEDHLQLPLDADLPDLNGEPARAVHIRMESFSPQNGPDQTIFRARVVRNFNVQTVDGNWWTGYESVLSPSATQRDTFEIRISRTHIKVWMPDYNLVWIDKNINDLGWSKGIVQFGHHSYTPTKDCPSGQTCGPNTWHWDNVSISPSEPFTMIKADRRFVDQSTAGQTVTFASPAPSSAHLRFVAKSGSTAQISLDNGQTWQNAHLQPTQGNDTSKARSYFTAIPQGTQQVRVRGTGGWWGSEWMARDFSIWSLDDAPVANCDPRPPVALSLTANGTGALTATVRAGAGSLSELRFHGGPSGSIPNPSVLVDIGPEVGRSGEFTFRPIPGTTQQSFTLRRASGSGSGSGTMQFDAVDACGVWSTLAGGGPNAWGGPPVAAMPEATPTTVTRTVTVPAVSASPVMSGSPIPGAACAQFASHSAAQASLRKNPSDPLLLDRSRNGIACEGADGAGFVSPPLDQTPVPRT